MKTFLMITAIFLKACSSSTSNKKNDSNSNDDDNPSSTTLPKTKIIVDSVDYYLVSTFNQTQVPYRYQLNFGTEEQYNTSVTESGQNSTFSVTMTFTKKPSSKSYDYTSSRFFTDSAKVNFYVTFFNGLDHTRNNKNYLSPDVGSINIDLSNGRLLSTINSVKLTNETDTSDHFITNGTLDFSF